MRNPVVGILSILVLTAGLSLTACEGTDGVTTETDITASEVTHAGIILEPSVGSPWPDLPVYRYPNVIENVSPGDEFCIGLDVNPRLGMEWAVTVDGQGVVLEETDFISVDPESPVMGTTWHRFRVSGTGNAFVIFELVTVSDIVTTRLMFTFYSIE